MVSTISMILLGHVRGNKMVDMQLTNSKLNKRAREIVMKELNVDIKKADELSFSDIERNIFLLSEKAKKGKIIIYKKGEKGSITFVENKEIYKGIFPVTPLKPTGAGDAFMGALIGPSYIILAFKNFFFAFCTVL